FEEVMVRRELQFAHHDLASRPVVAEAGADDPLRDRDVLVHRDRVPRYAEDRRQQVARLAPDFPPALVPGAHPAVRPLVGELLQVTGGPARHRAERMAHQVGAGFDDRKLTAPVLDVYSHTVTSERGGWGL